MEGIEIPERSSKRLNNAVAISVVLFSVFTAFSKIKDDNIVQAMQAAKADAVDTWSEYQAARVKQHLAENNLFLLKAQGGKHHAETEIAITTLSADISRYADKTKDLASKAKAFEAQYDALNFSDDQFDLSDAFIAVGVSLAAVSSLVELWWLLVVAWGAGGIGVVMGMAGFLGWRIHPDWLVRLFS